MLFRSEGTFSSHASRRKACRPCSRCRDDEYEIRPCTPTSNVVCRKCRQCPPGSEVEKSCERKKDTVCKKCNTLDSGRKCKNRGLQRTPGTKFSRHVSLVSPVKPEIGKSRLCSKQILKDAQCSEHVKSRVPNI